MEINPLKEILKRHIEDLHLDEFISQMLNEWNVSNLHSHRIISGNNPISSKIMAGDGSNREIIEDDLLNMLFNIQTISESRNRGIEASGQMNTSVVMAEKINEIGRLLKRETALLSSVRIPFASTDDVFANAPAVRPSVYQPPETDVNRQTTAIKHSGSEDHHTEDAMINLNIDGRKIGEVAVDYITARNLGLARGRGIFDSSINGGI